MSPEPSLSATLWGRESFTIKQVIDVVMTFDLAELWLETVFNIHVVVLRVLACASCNVANASIHRRLVTRVVFSMSSHQVSFQTCRATAALNICSTDLTWGQTSVHMSLLLIKSKSLTNFRFQISWCLVNSVGVVGHVVVVVVVVFPSDTLTLLSRECHVDL